MEANRSKEDGKGFEMDDGKLYGLDFRYDDSVFKWEWYNEWEDIKNKLFVEKA